MVTLILCFVIYLTLLGADLKTLISIMFRGLIIESLKQSNKSSK